MAHQRADGLLPRAGGAEAREEHLVPDALARGELGEGSDALAGGQALAGDPDDVLVLGDDRREREGDLDDGGNLGRGHVLGNRVGNASIDSTSVAAHVRSGASRARRRTRTSRRCPPARFQPLPRRWRKSRSSRRSGRATGWAPTRAWTEVGARFPRWSRAPRAPWWWWWWWERRTRRRHRRRRERRLPCESTGYLRVWWSACEYDAANGQAEGHVSWNMQK